jgi:hypothetical protein
VQKKSNLKEKEEIKKWHQKKKQKEWKI